jgi:hypothetical protein
MQQSSSSIGALATALAKAQIELVNPEKSMILRSGQTRRVAPRNLPVRTAIERTRDFAQDPRPI